MGLGEVWAALKSKEKSICTTVITYLDEIDKQGKAKKTDFFRVTNNQDDLERWIKLLMTQNFIEKNLKDGTYTKTKKGQIFHEILIKHDILVPLLENRELISLLTQSL